VRRYLVAAPLVGVLALAAWAEWVQWRASGRGLGSEAGPGTREAIVVLGYRDSGPGASSLNRHRVRVALRSIDPAADETVLVFCGGSVGGPTPEADLMRDYAVNRLGYAGPVQMDRESTTTWQNIENAIPLIEGFDRVKIASHSLHAGRARAHLRTQRPDIAERLVRASDYRPGEIVHIKVVEAVIDLARRRRTERDSPEAQKARRTGPEVHPPGLEPGTH
jgi:hypothetical protein